MTSEFAWITKSKFLNKISVDIQFNVKNKFGDSISLYNSYLSKKDYNNNCHHIYLSDIKSDDDIEDLIKYYESVFLAAKESNFDLEEDYSTYFWIMPQFNSQKDMETCVSFIWSDTYWEIESLFTDVIKLKDGELWNDIDQCWAVDIYRQGNIINIKEYDLDNDCVHSMISCKREIFVEQIKNTKYRLEYVLNYMTKRLGKNYWNHKKN